MQQCPLCDDTKAELRPPLPWPEDPLFVRSYPNPICRSCCQRLFIVLLVDTKIVMGADGEWILPENFVERDKSRLRQLLWYKKAEVDAYDDRK